MGNKKEISYKDKERIREQLWNDKNKRESDSKPSDRKVPENKTKN